MFRHKVIILLTGMTLGSFIAQPILAQVTGLTQVTLPASSFAVGSQYDPVLAYQLTGSAGNADTLPTSAWIMTSAPRTPGPARRPISRP